MLLIDGGGVAARTRGRSHLPHESAQRAAGLSYRVTITGYDIEDYEESGLTVVDGGVYDFVVERRADILVMTFVTIPGGTFQMGDVENAGPRMRNPYTL